MMSMSQPCGNRVMPSLILPEVYTSKHTLLYFDATRSSVEKSCKRSNALDLLSNDMQHIVLRAFILKTNAGMTCAFDEAR